MPGESGPGENGTQPTAGVAALEQEVLEAWPELVEVLVSQRVQASRRALRLFPADLQWNIVAEDLELAFTLPPGTYATTVLRELVLVTEPNRHE